MQCTISSTAEHPIDNIANNVNRAEPDPVEEKASSVDKPIEPACSSVGRSVSDAVFDQDL